MATKPTPFSQRLEAARSRRQAAKSPKDDPELTRLRAELAKEQAAKKAAEITAPSAGWRSYIKNPFDVNDLKSDLSTIGDKIINPGRTLAETLKGSNYQHLGGKSESEGSLKDLAVNMYQGINRPAKKVRGALRPLAHGVLGGVGEFANALGPQGTGEDSLRAIEALESFGPKGREIASGFVQGAKDDPVSLIDPGFSLIPKTTSKVRQATGIGAVALGALAGTKGGRAFLKSPIKTTAGAFKGWRGNRASPSVTSQIGGVDQRLLGGDSIIEGQIIPDTPMSQKALPPPSARFYGGPGGLGTVDDIAVADTLKPPSGTITDPRRLIPGKGQTTPRRSTKQPYVSIPGVGVQDPTNPVLGAVEVGPGGLNFSRLNDPPPTPTPGLPTLPIAPTTSRTGRPLNVTAQAAAERAARERLARLDAQAAEKARPTPKAPPKPKTPPVVVKEAPAPAVAPPPSAPAPQAPPVVTNEVRMFGNSPVETLQALAAKGNKHAVRELELRASGVPPMTAQSGTSKKAPITNRPGRGIGRWKSERGAIGKDIDQTEGGWYNPFKREPNPDAPPKKPGEPGLVTPFAPKSQEYQRIANEQNVTMGGVRPERGVPVTHDPQFGGYQQHVRGNETWVTHPMLPEPKGPFSTADEAFDWTLEHQETPEFRAYLDKYNQRPDKFGPKPEIPPLDKWDQPGPGEPGYVPPIEPEPRMTLDERLKQYREQVREKVEGRQPEGIPTRPSSDDPGWIRGGEPEPGSEEWWAKTRAEQDEYQSRMFFDAAVKRDPDLYVRTADDVSKRNPHFSPEEVHEHIYNRYKEKQVETARLQKIEQEGRGAPAWHRWADPYGKVEPEWVEPPFRDVNSLPEVPMNKMTDVRTHTTGTERMVPSRNWYAGQEGVDQAQMNRMDEFGLSNPSEAAERPPWVDIDENGNIQIQDGHHRSANALKNNQALDYRVDDAQPLDSWNRQVRGQRGPDSPFRQAGRREAARFRAQLDAQELGDVGPVGGGGAPPAGGGGEAEPSLFSRCPEFREKSAQLMSDPDYPERIAAWRQAQIEDGATEFEVDKAIRMSQRFGIDASRSDDLYDLGEYMQGWDPFGNYGDAPSFTSKGRGVKAGPTPEEAATQRAEGQANNARLDAERRAARQQDVGPIGGGRARGPFDIFGDERGAVGPNIGPSGWGPGQGRRGARGGGGTPPSNPPPGPTPAQTAANPPAPGGRQQANYVGPLAMFGPGSAIRRGVKTGAKHGFDIANQIRIASMLSGWALPKSLLGNMGSHGIAAIEELAAGGGLRSAAAPLKELLRVPTNVKNFGRGWKMGANPHIAGATNYGKWNPITRTMGAADYSATESLMRSGLSRREAQRLLLTDPRYGLRGDTLKQKIGGRNVTIPNPVADYFVPFRRTPFNVFLGGGHTMMKHPLLSTAAAGLGAGFGSSTDDPRMLGLASALAGPYTLPFLLGSASTAGLRAAQGLSPIPEWAIAKSLGDPLNPFSEPAFFRMFDEPGQEKRSPRELQYERREKGRQRPERKSVR